MPSQKELYDKYGARFATLDLERTIGISKDFGQYNLPIHGLRHPQTESTTGWYIQSGDYQETDSFFVSMHAKHVLDNWPELVPYLNLAPGWRFLINTEDGYEDIWEDSALLDITQEK